MKIYIQFNKIIKALGIFFDEFEIANCSHEIVVLQSIES